MAIKTYKPTTNGRRGMMSQDFDSITTNKPVRSLIRIKKTTTGRNNQGRITTRHRGGGVKRYYRIIDFKLEPGMTATIEHIEYDPNRSARIARIKDQNGQYHYILAARGMRPGRKISADEEASIEVGNRLPLKNIPTGTTIHAVELQPGKGAQFARTAGASAQLVAKDEQWAQVKMPSGEVRMVSLDCTASIGTVGNEQHGNVKLGKAGRKRHMGIRPTVHGKAMNPVDHPMGGGEGKSGPGRIPRTPWGKVAIGLKTRRRKDTSKYIVRTRRQAKRRK
jgi:large subunit ribosomal protein L2